MITVDNYYLDAEVETMVSDIKANLTNGKLAFCHPSTSGYSVPCPVHKNGLERKNSCFIDPETGGWHCFTCGARGNFVKFVQECFGWSDQVAKDWLIKKYGKQSFATLKLGDDICIKKANYVAKLDDSILDGYASWTPYLAQRKLDRTICEHFNVRYDSKERQVIFPVYDTKDNLIMFARRSIDTKYFHMPAELDKPVYNLNIIIKNNLRRCMICEGPIDALTGWCHNVPTIATLGEISDEQIEALNHAGINILYVAFDNDFAGGRFRATLQKKLKNTIMQVFVKLPRLRKDVNDLTDEEWEKLITDNNLPQIDINSIKF